MWPDEGATLEPPEVELAVLAPAKDERTLLCLRALSYREDAAF